MNVLIVALGSAGDVHPFLPIAGTLAARGHRVTLFANEVFRDVVESVPGVAFAQAGDAETFHRLTGDPNLFHPRHGAKLVFGTTVAHLREAVDALREHVVPGETVMAGSTLALGARLVQEADGVPLATVHLQPSVLPSAYEMPRMPAGNLPRWAPRWLKRLFWRLAGRALGGIAQPGLDEERARLGLPPLRQSLLDWWSSPERVIGLFPEWFAPRQPDWPESTVLTGFPLFDASSDQPAGDDLMEWITAEEPPIVWTAGSAQHHAADFFAAAVDASRRLGRRALLVSPAPETVPSPLPAGMLHRAYVPFGAVFPRAVAAVHHGGVGTMAQAFAAAVPQLVVPWAHDQYDNGARVERLGLGATLPAPRFRPDRATDALARLLGSRKIHAACRAAAERMRSADPVATTCDLIEALEPGGLKASQDRSLSRSFGDGPIDRI